MRNTYFLTLALGLCSTASSFALPEIQAEDIYQVRRSSSDEDVHTTHRTPPFRRTSTTASSSPFSMNHLIKRDWGHTYCGCDYDLSESDTDAAVGDLKTQLVNEKQWVDPSGSRYSVHGEVVAFVCNEDGNAPLKTWPDIVMRAAEQISNACGKYVAGSTGGDFEFAIGYMKYKEGFDFCGDALRSPVGSC